MDSSRISYLFNQLEKDSITTDEREELYSLLRSFENTNDILAWLEDSYKKTTPQAVDTEKWKPILEYIIAQPGEDAKPGVSFGRPQGDGQHGVSQSGPRVVQMFRNKTFRWVAAASVIVIASLIVILSLSKNDNGTKPTVATTHDVPAPSNTRAVITLADGRKVYLDSAGNGTLAQENNVNIVRNKEGEILYMSPAGGGDLNESSNNKRPGVVYNTLFNPRGSKVISLTLSDGTKVWLNSESSLRYPANFSASSAFREVDITGEAYFEVKHNSKQPFKVHLPNGSIVEDIGTSFNINAYPDEENIKTTLIEGSIAVSLSLMKTAALRKVLTPGQQAVVSLRQAQTDNRSITVTNNIDIDKIVSWKNNEFNFQDDDIQTIMRQLARWYNIRPVITGTSSTNYTGRITRDVPLSKVLEMFEKVGYVKFEISGSEVRVINK